MSRTRPSARLPLALVLLPLVYCGLAGTAIAESQAPPDIREQIGLRSHGSSSMAVLRSSFFRDSDSGPFACKWNRQPLKPGGALPMHGGDALVMRAPGAPLAVQIWLEDEQQRLSNAIRATAATVARRAWRVTLPHDLRGAHRIGVQASYPHDSFVRLAAPIRRHPHARRTVESRPRSGRRPARRARAAVDISCKSPGCGEGYDYWPGIGCAREAQPGFLEVKLSDGSLHYIHKGADSFPLDPYAFGVLRGFRVRLARNPRAARLETTLTRGVAFGVKVERVARQLPGSSAPNLRQVGTVLFGRRPPGRLRLAWNLRVGGRPLAPGRYLITPRAGYGPGRLLYYRDPRILVVPGG